MPRLPSTDLLRPEPLVDDAGYASELAAKKLDNLSGDLEALKGSIETAFIQSGTIEPRRER